MLDLAITRPGYYIYSLLEVTIIEMKHKKQSLEYATGKSLHNKFNGSRLYSRLLPVAYSNNYKMWKLKIILS